MEEVKKWFQKRQYKNCSARCIQILDGIKDPTRAHPLYLTWMTFYAAASLEQMSRSLHVSSSEKLPLLQQCLSYYENTESYLQRAPYPVNTTVTQAQQHSSSASSSPNPSTEFSLSATESTVLPLSTLPSPIDTFPEPKSRDRKANTCITEDIKPLSQPPPDFGISAFLLSRSLSRYHAHLTGMQTQLRYHVASVNKQITVLQEVRKARRSNRPTLFAAFSVGGIDGMDMVEMKKAELKARIERLRETGWKRERFDAERYQRLCGHALAELGVD